MIGWYDRQGKPITMEAASELLGDEEYKRVAEDTIGPYWVSTVWLGLDHGFMRKSPPLIFETMVFANEEIRGDGPMFDLDCARYFSEEEARRGHDAMCLLVRATLSEDVPVEEESPCDAEH